MKLKPLSITKFITAALIVLTALSAYDVFSDASTVNVAGNIILLICLFFLTWTALLLNRVKYSNLPPN